MNESCVYTLLGFGATRTATARVNRFTTLWICLHYAEARTSGDSCGDTRDGSLPRGRTIYLDRDDSAFYAGMASSGSHI